MGKVKFELNLRGLNELMKGSEMQGVLSDAGRMMAQAAGSDYGSDVHVASFVAIANVYPNSKRAAHENFTENTLLKAAGSVKI